MKDFEKKSIENIFNEERNYTYYYIRALEGVRLYYEKNEDTGEKMKKNLLNKASQRDKFRYSYSTIGALVE
ncbi:hypothetical protein [Cytobacillus solani]|uniref:hypothetical protein n=1 Tax=Cytobacillus solani TaxID=1637975 RepID=UPI001BAB8E99|nr:hypothetical protein [Cytobacillus solani]